MKSKFQKKIFFSFQVFKKLVNIKEGEPNLCYTFTKYYTSIPERNIYYFWAHALPAAVFPKVLNSKVFVKSTEEVVKKKLCACVYYTLEEPSLTVFNVFALPIINFSKKYLVTIAKDKCELIWVCVLFIRRLVIKLRISIFWRKIREIKFIFLKKNSWNYPALQVPETIIKTTSNI